ncbi:MAG TPA: carboxypeptidase-like regulatory domain-containing protein [Phycisphaerae bacterium]|nr:carboxypeptidase-like regulatory domain-containing protein [Phycisphaerae bacterium]
MVLIRPYLRSLVCLLLLVAGGCDVLPFFGGDNGINGVILAGPTCPFQMEGEDCDDRPIAATVIVRQPFGFEVTRFTSDDDGRFRVELPPGNYQLDPQPNECCIGTAPFQTVTVQDGQFNEIVISYDTGIR